MDQNTTEPLFGLQVDSKAIAQFREGTKWARFIALVYLIGILVLTCVLIFAGAAITAFFEEVMPGMGMMDMGIIQSALVGVFIVVFAIAGIINLLLLRFATLVRRGIEQQNQEIFNDGLKFLKYYCIINGVIALLGVIFSVFSTLTLLFA